MKELYQLYVKGPEFDYINTIVALGGNRIYDTGVPYYTSSISGGYILATSFYTDPSIGGTPNSMTTAQPVSATIIPIREF